MKKTANLRELRESNDAELVARTARLEEELFGHRMKRFTNQLENTTKIRQARREIARVKTLLAARKAGTETKAAQSVQAETPANQES